MNLEDILGGESKTIEFKEELPADSRKYMKTVVAFSNTAGGKIIIGISDKTKQIVGVSKENVFLIMDGIMNAVTDMCVPQIIPEITLQSIDDKTLIIIEVYPGKQRPYYIASEGKENGTYIRTNGSSRHVDSIQLKELEFEGTNKYFDQTYAVGHEATGEQINVLCREMKQYALAACENENEKKSIKDITQGNLLSWGILIKQENNILPSNAFVLLTENDFPQAKIQCAVFKGITRNIFIDKKEYTGPIFSQIDEAYQFVLRNIKLGAKIKGLVRVDTYEIPVNSIRELIINAVTHRSYLDEGCVQVAIFDDRIEITSPGMLFGGLSIEDIKEGQSRPRNRAIASAFSAMKLIEQWGSGIPRVIDECRSYGLKEPELIELGMSFRVNIYRENEDITVKSLTKKTNTKEDIIMAFLDGNGEISTAEVMRLCGYKSRGAARNVLNKMVADNLVVRVGRGAQLHYEKNSGHFMVNDQ